MNDLVRHLVCNFLLLFALVCLATFFHLIGVNWLANAAFVATALAAVKVDDHFRKARTEA